MSLISPKRARRDASSLRWSTSSACTREEVEIDKKANDSSRFDLEFIAFPFRILDVQQALYG
jgi:hypothetical protein